MEEELNDCKKKGIYSKDQKSILFNSNIQLEMEKSSVYLHIRP